MIVMGNTRTIDLLKSFSSFKYSCKDSWKMNHFNNIGIGAVSGVFFRCRLSEVYDPMINVAYVAFLVLIDRNISLALFLDDCLKIKKEREEKSDAVSLEMLVEIIRESMLLFREFLFGDKKSTNVATKIDLQDLGNSELLSGVISNLQKVRFLVLICGSYVLLRVLIRLLCRRSDERETTSEAESA